MLNIDEASATWAEELVRYFDKGACCNKVRGGIG